MQLHYFAIFVDFVFDYNIENIYNLIIIFYLMSEESKKISVFLVYFVSFMCTIVRDTL